MMLRHLGTKTLETERLILRRFTVNDVDAMYAWASDPEVAGNMRYERHQNKEETKELLQMWSDTYDDPTVYNWAIELKENHDVIGSIGMVDSDEHDRKIAVGYNLRRDMWGHGYAPEALRCVIHYAIFDVGFNRVYGYYFLNNPNSCKVQQKAGMKFEGILRQYVYVKGEYKDVGMNAIVRSDFEN
ncbi:hypothetical protein WA158_001489 [Blastocystis sp. Blastoise]